MRLLTNMVYKIEFFRDADKSFGKLYKNTQKRITKYLVERVMKDPFSNGKALTGDKVGLLRYRIGDYRIICRIETNKLVVVVIDIGHRSNVYK